MGRVAQVVPERRPFAGAFWAALTAGKRADELGLREAPPKSVANKRFTTAAKWLIALIAAHDEHEHDLAHLPDGLFVLERRISASRLQRATAAGWVIQSDASPWGAGAILRHDSKISEYFSVKWKKEDFPARLGIEIGQPAFQAFFEFLAILLGLLQWGRNFTREPCLVTTDSTGALQNALDQCGHRLQLVISRELAWRKARYGWLFDVGHLPRAFNVVPDTLSRAHAPDAPAWPFDELDMATDVGPPLWADMWKCV